MTYSKQKSFFQTVLILSALFSTAMAQTPPPGSEFDYWQDDDFSFNGSTRLFLGYTATIPSQNLGFTFGFTRPHAWGLYADYKMNIETLEIANYLYDDLTVEYVEKEYYYDTLIDIRSYWVTIDAGITWPLSRYFCGYGGAGVSFHKFYRQYHEPYGYKGDNGYYWINDETTSSVGLNLSAGVLYRLGRYLFLQLGGDIKPLGVAASVGLCL
jgi:opacity protein-like surface antigen